MCGPCVVIVAVCWNCGATGTSLKKSSRGISGCVWATFFGEA
jgi:hypothetical protein